MLAVNGYTHIVGRYPFIIGSEIIGTPKGLFSVDRFRCYMDRYSMDDQIGQYFRVYGLPVLQISRADSGVVKIVIMDKYEYLRTRHEVRVHTQYAQQKAMSN